MAGGILCALRAHTLRRAAGRPPPAPSQAEGPPSSPGEGRAAWRPRVTASSPRRPGQGWRPAGRSAPRRAEQRGFASDLPGVADHRVWPRTRLLPREARGLPGNARLARPGVSRGCPAQRGGCWNMCAELPAVHWLGLVCLVRPEMCPGSCPVVHGIVRGRWAEMSRLSFWKACLPPRQGASTNGRPFETCCWRGCLTAHADPRPGVLPLAPATRAGPSKRPTEIVASGNKLVGVPHLSWPTCPRCFPLLLLLPGLGKRRGTKTQEIGKGSAELKHWIVAGAEAGTSLGKGAAFGMGPGSLLSRDRCLIFTVSFLTCCTPAAEKI